MITSIKGKVLSRAEQSLTIETAGIAYEIFVPMSVLQRVTENQDSNGEIRLITYHYYQMTPSAGVPVLIGFLNELERDFFLEFIKVSGIGPRAAVRALNQSIADIAHAIDRSDMDFLKTLPGIGLQRAKDIVAKLGGKMGRFNLMQDKVVPLTTGNTQLKQEALEILIQLQYKRPEAERMIEVALSKNTGIKTSEELLNEIYKQRIKG